MSTGVSLSGLTKSYGKGAANAVDGVSLEVPAGQLVALLGPSGCGKSTTLKLIAGLLEPDAGDIRFDGSSIVGIAPERRPVAMVFQKPLLFPNMSVGRNVGFGLRMARVSRARIAARVGEMLDLVRLSGFEGRAAGELSGGQEQRVSLARALIVEPEVLLLDEPFSQLDANLRVEMRDLVRRVQREVGVTTLFVTHDQEEAVSLADSIALMLDGAIEQYGRPEEFYARPASVRVGRFFGASNLFEGVVADGSFSAGFGSVAVGPSAPEGRCVLVVRQEAVELVAPGAPGSIEAVVRATTFLGTHVRVCAVPTATTGIGAEVEVTLSVEPTRRVAAGDRVALRLPAEHCHVIPV